MTVDQLIKELQKKSFEGYGKDEVYFDVSAYRDFKEINYIIVDYVLSMNELANARPIVARGMDGDKILTRSVELS